MSQAHADCPHCRQDGSEAKHIALKEVRIALAGNPNCGKTTAFNEYTGTHQHVGNYPGVTVDKKEGYVSIDGVEVLMVDLPGTYSLTAYSQEEIVTRAVLAPEKAEEKPMAVVDLVDTSALERNLFLTVQIMEMGLPVVLACNMMDEARKAGIQVNTKELGKQLGIPVVATVARSGEGLKDALREAVAFGRRGSAPLNISYGPDLDPVLTKMERLLAEKGLLTDRYPRPLDCPEGAGKRFRNPEAGGTYARCGRAAARRPGNRGRPSSGYLADVARSHHRRLPLRLYPWCAAQRGRPARIGQGPP